MFGYVWSLDICLFNCCCLDVVFHLSSVHRFSLWGFELYAMVPCQFFGSSVLSSFSSMPKSQLPRCFSRHWVTMVTWIMDPYGSLWIPQVWWRMQRLIWDLQWLLALDIVLFGYLILGGWRKENHAMEDQASFEHRVCHGMPQNSSLIESLSPWTWPRIWMDLGYTTILRHPNVTLITLQCFYGIIPLHPHENPMKASLNYHWISGALIIGDRCFKEIRTATTWLVRPCGMCWMCWMCYKPWKSSSHFGFRAQAVKMVSESGLNCCAQYTQSMASTSMDVYGDTGMSQCESIKFGGCY